MEKKFLFLRKNLLTNQQNHDIMLLQQREGKETLQTRKENLMTTYYIHIHEEDGIETAQFDLMPNETIEEAIAETLEVCGFAKLSENSNLWVDTLYNGEAWILKYKEGSNVMNLYPVA